MLVLGKPRVVRGDYLALLLPLCWGLALGGLFAGHKLLSLGPIGVTHLCYESIVVQGARAHVENVVILHREVGMHHRRL